MERHDRLLIGALAKATGTKVVTIRYYEQIGLLAPPVRTAGNYRAYDRTHLRRLGFIRRCRGLGFTLDQIRTMLDLAGRHGHDCAEVDRIALEHLDEVEAKIADLQRLAGELRRLSSQCQGGVIGECGIIEALSPDLQATRDDGRSLQGLPNA
ncbi:Cu(I)-responsive transcriptional regulator [Constrictibacter sp. MBR-5]|jgi:Cu(I)-responsive transcriptional regulator|uniref:MerR family transcriptional regulator n=1 Tax=Constrictibacter sp. MBR-5 TaxID=3156467 RepID=UPI0033928239